MNYFPVGKSGLNATYNGIENKLKGLQIINLTSPNATPNAKFFFNGSLYICGVKNYNGFLKRYNDKEWIDISLPSSRIYNGVAYNEKVHLFTSDGKHYEWYGSTFTLLGDVPGYSQGSAYIVFDGKIHKIGGYSGGSYSTSTSNHYVWDGESWTSTTSLPQSMYNARTAVNGNKLYILGYQYYSDNNSSNSTKCYSLDTNGVWTTETDVPQVQNDTDWLGSAESYDGKLHYVVRSDYDSNYGDFIRVYTLDNGVWTYAGINTERGNALVNYRDSLRIIGKKTHAILSDGKWMVAQPFPYDNIIVPILKG